MKLYRLKFKSNPDLIVNAEDPAHAKEVAVRIHEIDGQDTSAVVSATEVNTLGQLFYPEI